MQKAKNLFFALAICSFVFSFATDVFANESATEQSTAVTVAEKAVEEKTQVRYQVRFIDENQKEIDLNRTKIGFSGDEVSERAIVIPNYELVSPQEQKLVLAKEGNIIVFEYRSVDAQKLMSAKEAAIEKIEQLKKISTAQKNSAKSDVQNAKSEAEVLAILEKIQKSNDAVKAQVKYQVKYLDKKGKEIEKSKTKIGFDGEVVTEKAIDITKFVKPEEPKIVKLAEGKDNIIVFEYEEIPKVQVKYQIKFVDTDGKEIAPSVTKIGFTGEIVTEKAGEVKKYIQPQEPQIITLEENMAPIVFTYGKTDESKTVAEFIREKLDLDSELVYTDTNFAGRPDDLKDYVIKSIYKRKLAVTFYATDDDVDKLYWNLWNKPVDASLVRIARFWTARDGAKSNVDTGIPGVNRYSIGITYHITKQQLMEAEDKIDEIIEKYNVKAMSDLEKAKFIYDYLILNTAVNQDNDRGYNRYNHSAVLVANAGVCEGYTMAYNRIAERAGLQSRFVSGIYYPEWNPKAQKRYFDAVLPQMQTEVFDKKLNHAWNQVNIDGQWYHVDSYHGDYYYTNKVPSMVYDSFLRSAQNIGKNRIWNYNFTHNSPADYPQKFYKISDLK
ncbi:MAG: transglutaminase domain-containing protein [Peptostreptococcaceae bacterium]|nr:transglutaminase domain-containing protein [Peptostreptococcaceae bacterium]